ncbi:hypothetical protein [Borrelia sp. RT1S]|nr:hypothetical protein [Borrelia sp. RT1S]UGQ17634.1 hypothetical protein LSO05_04495 [Borrelia sp. RT1S]
MKFCSLSSKVKKRSELIGEIGETRKELNVRIDKLDARIYSVRSDRG